MSKIYAAVLPLLMLWLLASIIVSWGAVQDDALIHLRYADNLIHGHSIAYDGAHRDYGASSLLYVALLAGLRKATMSPELPRAVSSVVHGVLFGGLALLFHFRIPERAFAAKAAGLIALTLITTPSAVRWLDDGMETGIVVLLASLLAWQMHDQTLRDESGEGVTAGRYLLLAALAFLAVLLRTELVLLCGFGFLLLTFGGKMTDSRSFRWCRRPLTGLSLLLGAGLALGLILATMRVLLPDTAIAKSHGLSHWFNPIHDTAITLGGAFSFGMGTFAFWLVTLLLSVQHRGRPGIATVLTNAFFPVVLALATLRGQEIQGVRYFAWTFFFPIVWNILELARVPKSGTKLLTSRSVVALGVFLALLAAVMPFETRVIYRVLTHRGETMRSFEAQHLDVLRERRGIASDIGYIGYFTGAKLCDLAGLVNGRAAARLNSAQRNQACVETNPEFLFVNSSQLDSLRKLADFSGWQICGRYDFTNVRTLDRHYLLVRPSIADEVCRATGDRPEPMETLLAAQL